MKREIKFKAYDRRHGQWRYGYYFEDSHGYYIYDGKTGTTWKVDPDTLCQFTGLIDVAGIEIYESDLVCINEEDTVVHYERGCFYTKLAGGKYRLGGWTDDSVEVFGNSYDPIEPNPFTN